MELWARGFRPFFLLAGVSGLVLPALWIAALSGWVAPPAALSPVVWHAHEMLFGFAGAAIAGFLLTSVPVWTGTPPVVGWRLGALAGLWLAGRLGFAASGWLAPSAVAVVDLLFLPAVTAAVAVPILRTGNRRNYGVPLVLLALFGADLATHLRIPDRAGAADLGTRAGVLLVTLLIVLIGGRIVPAFTANALARRGCVAPLRARPRLGTAALIAVSLFAVADLSAPGSLPAGAAALLASLLLFLRLAGWRLAAVRDDPLVWSLHLGYAWVPIGLAVLGLSALGLGLPRTLGVHLLTAGAMGGMILAVMTRVALGHTGRPLSAPAWIPCAYGLVALGALIRSAGPLLWPDAPLSVLVLSALPWSGGFAIFLGVYAPILTSPRIDGRPG